MERLPAAVLGGEARHRQILEAVKNLRSLRSGEALLIEFGDHDGSRLEFLVAPHDTIKFAYASVEDERAAQPLVERCARVLDCEVVVI